MPLKLFIFLVVLLAVIFQVSVMPIFFPSGAIPDLIIILLVFFTAEAGFERVWKGAIFFGLIADIVFFALLGTNAVSFLIIAYVTELAARRFLAGQKIWKSLILALVAGAGLIVSDVANIVLAGSASYFYKIGYHANFSWSIAAKSALYTFILSAIIYWPFKKIKNMIISRRELKI
jgi:rod shape-determining protein MreD